MVSAVGHETDFTICDFVADLRAPTPSAAAELCTPDRAEELHKLLSFHQYFQDKAQKTVEYLRQSVDVLVQDSPLGDPKLFLKDRKERLGMLAGQLLSETVDRMESGKKELSLLSGKLDALSPLKVLARGYSVVTDAEGEVVRDARALVPGGIVTIHAAQGTALARVLEREDG